MEELVEQSALKLFPQSPYDIQRKFVRALIELLDRAGHEGARVGIFESPTGTGKTASLLCGTLGWLLNKRHVNETNQTAVIKESQENLFNNSVNEPDWIRQARQELIINNRINTPPQLKKRKIEEEYNSDDIAHLLTRINQEETKFGVGQTKKITNVPILKVFYASRTHSQLGQVMNELRSILRNQNQPPFESDPLLRVKAISLASRQALCINEAVLKMGTLDRINEQCQELQDQKEGCPYYLKASVDDQQDHCHDRARNSLSSIGDHQARRYDTLLNSLSSVADVEELVQKGRTHCQCPYYGARELISQPTPHSTSLVTDPKEIVIVTLPYHSLLHPTARASLGIDLKDAVVIFDEAHNLVNFINELDSVTITGRSLQSFQYALKRYLDKVSNRIAPERQVKSNQLQYIIGCLLNRFEFKSSNVTLQVNEFLIERGIDHINLLPILDYCRESHLATKLPNYQDDHSKSLDANVGYRILDFLASLAEANADGRIIIDTDDGTSNTDISGYGNEDEETLLSKLRLRYVALNPATAMTPFINEAHAVILAGGTMQPAEDIIFQLFPSLIRVPPHGTSYSRGVQLYSFNHLINGEENCCGVIMSKGPTGLTFNFTHQMFENPTLMNELAQAIINVCRIVPNGVVVFFASYRWLDHFLAHISDSTHTMVTFESRIRKRLHVERPSTTTNTSSFFGSYAHDCYQGEGALLLGVMGGRLSEGVNFGDGLARGVLLVGLPYPNLRDPEIKLRADHYATICKGIKDTDKGIQNPNKGIQENQLSKEMNSTFLEGICMRTINQTLGRAIRHREDWATIILLDERYHTKRVQDKLSTWFRACLRTSTTTTTTTMCSFEQSFSQLVSFFRRKRREKTM